MNETPDQIQENKELFDFNEASTRFQKAVKDWDARVTNPAKVRRNMRSIEIDVRALQLEGKLKVDETIIPIRVIDTNIKSEQPNYLKYVAQSARLAIFKCLDDPNIDESAVQKVEKEFTASMTYNGWKTWVFKTVDGAELHGFCCVEVEFDSSRPGNVNISAYPHEDVIFPNKARDLEYQPWVMIRIPITLQKLKDFVDRYGFDAAQVKFIQDKYKDKSEIEQDIYVYKIFVKSDGVIFVEWASFDEGCNNWLKAPTQLYLGRDKLTTETTMAQDPMSGLLVPQQTQNWVPIAETLFPIKIFKYQETEDTVITETKGRAFLDAPTQEAQTALWSSYVNAAVRASNVYGSPKQTSGNKPTRLELTLEHGCFYSEPMEFFHTDFPNYDVIRASQALQVQKQVESGQVANAAMTRADTRKLAKELELATETADQLSSVQISNFATFLTEVFTHAWTIIQSRALQEKINFCQIQSVDPLTGQPAWKNDLALISHTYQVRPAGDTDVLRRAEVIQRRLQILPIIQQVIATIGQAPLTAGFMVEYAVDLLREVLPEDADKYERILRDLLAIQQQMLQQQMMQMQQQPQQKEASNEPTQNIQ